MQSRFDMLARRSGVGNLTAVRANGSRGILDNGIREAEHVDVRMRTRHDVYILDVFEEGLIRVLQISVLCNLYLHLVLLEPLLPQSLFLEQSLHLPIRCTAINNVTTAYQ